MQEKPPLITIVIPSYNRLLLLKEAVASVIVQTFPDWELIVADDGSEDGTADWILSIPDERIKVLKLPHGGNIAAARNAGVNMGSGKWIAFLDSDDLWVPEKLEIQLETLQQQGRRWTYGGFELINEEKEKIRNHFGEYRPVSGWIIRQLINNDASVNVSSLMLERKLFDEVEGFNTDFRLFCREDYEFTLRLAQKAEVVAIPDTILLVREHSGRTTKSLRNGYEHSAFVYAYFLSICGDEQLSKLARRQMAHELAESSVKNFQYGNQSKAVRQLYEAVRNGDSLRHLLSAIRRYFL